MKFRRKLVTIEAVQWWSHGDHRAVTKYPAKSDDKLSQLKKFGWLETRMGGHIIRPGEWIITHANGELSSCTPDSFERIYEAVTNHRELPIRERDRSA